MLIHLAATFGLCVSALTYRHRAQNPAHKLLLRMGHVISYQSSSRRDHVISIDHYLEWIMWSIISYHLKGVQWSLISYYQEWVMWSLISFYLEGVMWSQLLLRMEQGISLCSYYLEFVMWFLISYYNNWAVWSLFSYYLTSVMWYFINPMVSWYEEAVIENNFIWICKICRCGPGLITLDGISCPWTPGDTQETYESYRLSVTKQKWSVSLVLNSHSP